MRSKHFSHPGIAKRLISEVDRRSPTSSDPVVSTVPVGTDEPWWDEEFEGRNLGDPRGLCVINKIYSCENFGD